MSHPHGPNRSRHGHCLRGSSRAAWMHKQCLPFPFQLIYLKTAISLPPRISVSPFAPDTDAKPSSALCRCPGKAGKYPLPGLFSLHIHPGGERPALPGARVALVQAAVSAGQPAQAGRGQLLAELLHLRVHQLQLPPHLPLRLPQIALGVFQKATVRRHRHAAKRLRARARPRQPALVGGKIASRVLPRGERVSEGTGALAAFHLMTSRARRHVAAPQLP